MPALIRWRNLTVTSMTARIRVLMLEFCNFEHTESELFQLVWQKDICVFFSHIVAMQVVLFRSPFL